MSIPTNIWLTSYIFSACRVLGGHQPRKHHDSLSAGASPRILQVAPLLQQLSLPQSIVFLMLRFIKSSLLHSLSSFPWMSILCWSTLLPSMPALAFKDRYLLPLLPNCFKSFYLSLTLMPFLIFIIASIVIVTTIINKKLPPSWMMVHDYIYKITSRLITWKKL